MKITFAIKEEMEKEARKISDDIIGKESHWEMFLQEAYDKIARRKFHKGKIGK